MTTREHRPARERGSAMKLDNNITAWLAAHPFPPPNRRRKKKFKDERGAWMPVSLSMGPGYYEIREEKPVKPYPEHVAFQRSKATPRFLESTSFSKDQLEFMAMENNYDALKHDLEAWERGVPISTGERHPTWLRMGRPITRGPSVEERQQRAKELDTSMCRRIDSIHSSGARGASFPMVHTAEDNTDPNSIANRLVRAHKDNVPGFMATTGERFPKPVQSLSQDCGVVHGYHQERGTIRWNTLQDDKLQALRPSFGTSGHRFMSARDVRREAIGKIRDNAGSMMRPILSEEELEVSQEYNDYLSTL